jgi:hypothetical protein
VRLKDIEQSEKATKFEQKFTTRSKRKKPEWAFYIINDKRKNRVKGKESSICQWQK